MKSNGVMFVMSTTKQQAMEYHGVGVGDRSRVPIAEWRKAIPSNAIGWKISICGVSMVFHGFSRLSNFRLSKM